MYHHIGETDSDPWSLSVTPGHLAEQLEVLRKLSNPLKLLELTKDIEKGCIRHRSVIITFDDGYADNLHYAKPLLERFDIPATIFLITGYFGRNREFWWDELEKICLQPGKLPNVLRLNINGENCEWNLGEFADYSEAEHRRNLDWRIGQPVPSGRHSLYHSVWQRLQPLPEEEIEQILNSLWELSGATRSTRPGQRSLTVEEAVVLGEGNLIEIGAHSVSHALFPILSTASQKEEVQNSKTRLEEILGHPVVSFAYPYGQYTQETIPIVRDLGFKCACSTAPTSVSPGTDHFQLPRLQVHDWDGDEFSRQLTNWFTA